MPRTTAAFYSIGIFGRIDTMENIDLIDNIDISDLIVENRRSTHNSTFAIKHI